MIGAHYCGTTDFLSFTITMEHYYHMYNKRPLILTEFAPAAWDAKTIEQNRYKPEDVLQFAKVVIPWLESTPYILAYLWFSFAITDPICYSSALFTTTGELTELGHYYQGIR